MHAGSWFSGSRVWLHTPSTQVSMVQVLSSSHSLASVQEVQFGIGSRSHRPCWQVAVSHVAGWQSPSLAHGRQPSSATWLQLPSAHASAVQALPSSQGAPSAFSCRQPTSGSQLSVVHGLPSSQPGVSCWQPPAGSQASLVHASWSSQSSGPATKQPLAESQPSVVQALPSSQLPGSCRQPTCMSQVSVVQGLWSSQSIGATTQPLAGSQESMVQALWSSQMICVWLQPLAVSQASAVHAF